MVLVLLELWEAAAAVKLAGNRPSRAGRPKTIKKNERKNKGDEVETKKVAWRTTKHESHRSSLSSAVVRRPHSPENEAAGERVNARE